MNEIKKTKTQKGITLVALIITIIVLLILAIVAIGAIQNDGILRYAKLSRNDYENARANEQTTLGEYFNQIKENTEDPGSKITWTKTSEGDLAVGSTVVTSTGENFYVIGFKDNNQTVKLLAKDCIDTTEFVQSASAATVSFCETSVVGYWGDGTAPYDISETKPIPSTHTAAYVANRYGASLGVTGRLLLSSEADELKKTHSDILCGKNGTSSTNGLYYWLGSAYGVESVYYMHSLYEARFSEHYSSKHTVRPVIEIAASKIS